MSELEVQQSILKLVTRMSMEQQIKLLEFINSMQTSNRPNKPKRIQKFSGIFDDETVREFNIALKDCEVIDKNEW